MKSYINIRAYKKAGAPWVTVFFVDGKKFEVIGKTLKDSISGVSSILEAIH
ncbi:MAG: hypothetical protein ACRBCS_15970 [Cellvibrionaceae bacterium]